MSGIRCLLWLLLPLFFLVSCSEKGASLDDQTVDEVIVIPSAVRVLVGQNVRLTAHVRGEANPSQNVHWSSKDNEIAEVDSEGLVTGNSVGTTLVTATSAVDPKVAKQVEVVVLDEWDDERPADAYSHDLINEALDRGDIDEETALIYRVFAIFGDDRLPPEYRGLSRRYSSVMWEVVWRFDELSPLTQEILAPFRLPPSAPHSWMSLPGHQKKMKSNKIEWHNVITQNDEVKVWWQGRYPDDQARARTIADAIDGVIWQRLVVELMQRQPLSDDGLENNGGDGRLDIYLVRIAGDGMAVGYHGMPTPAYLLVNGNSQDLLPTTVHEMMHAIQFSYNISSHVGDYIWLMEATATWAEDFVYPDDQSEHGFAHEYLGNHNMSLNHVDGGFEYGAYLWPFFLARTQNPGIIRETWELTVDHSSLEASNQAISQVGGFEKQWPLFVVRNLNMEPFDFYWEQDTLAEAAIPLDHDAALGSQREVVHLMADELAFLSAEYHHFRNFDGNARSLAFFNGSSYRLERFDGRRIPMALDDDERRGAGVQALVRFQGEDWKLEDWTDLEARAFCRVGDEDILSELIIIYGNAEHRPDGANHPALLPRDQPSQLFVSNMNCNAWSGTITGVNQGREAHEEVTMQVTFQGVPHQGFENGFGYELTQGSMHWQVNGVEDDCVVSGTATIPLEPSPTNALITMNFVETGDLERAVLGGISWPSAGSNAVRVTETHQCGDNTHTVERAIGHFWFRISAEGLADAVKVSDDGRSISGSANQLESGGVPSIAWNWHLTAQ